MIKQSEIVDSIHADLDGRVTKSDVRRVLAGLAERVKHGLAKGGQCVVPGVGRVKLVVRRGRSGTIAIGSAAGSKYKTKAKMVPKMVFAKAVRDAAGKNKVAKTAAN